MEGDEDDGEWVELEYTGDASDSEEEEDEEESQTGDGAQIEVVHEDDCLCSLCWGDTIRRFADQREKSAGYEEDNEAASIDEEESEPESIPANVRVVKEYTNWTRDDDDRVYYITNKGEKPEPGPEEYYYPGWSSPDDDVSDSTPKQDDDARGDGDCGVCSDGKDDASSGWEGGSGDVGGNMSEGFDCDGLNDYSGGDGWSEGSDDGGFDGGEGLSDGWGEAAD